MMFLGSQSLLAADRTEQLTFQAALSRVPAVEVPARAAELVEAAKADERGLTTIEVVQSAVRLNPTAAPAIVGAIAHAVPAMASIAAAAAAQEQPKLASAIAKAAAAAAPTQAGKIAAAVCKAV